tara:strand:- start:24 stop:917 length:894 start_codon:yes stop_codon:yes gene_type:complete
LAQKRLRQVKSQTERGVPVNHIDAFDRQADKSGLIEIAPSLFERVAGEEIHHNAPLYYFDRMFETSTDGSALSPDAIARNRELQKLGNTGNFLTNLLNLDKRSHQAVHRLYPDAKSDDTGILLAMQEMSATPENFQDRLSLIKQYKNLIAPQLDDAVNQVVQGRDLLTDEMIRSELGINPIEYYRNKAVNPLPDGVSEIEAEDFMRKRLGEIIKMMSSQKGIKFKDENLEKVMTPSAEAVRLIDSKMRDINDKEKSISINSGGGNIYVTGDALRQNGNGNGKNGKHKTRMAGAQLTA